jgi:hypothetical protein
VGKETRGQGNELTRGQLTRERVDKPTRLQAYFAGKSQRQKGCETLQTYEFKDLRTQKQQTQKLMNSKKIMNTKAYELKK